MTFPASVKLSGISPPSLPKLPLRNICPSQWRETVPHPRESPHSLSSSPLRKYPESSRDAVCLHLPPVSTLVLILFSPSWCSETEKLKSDVTEKPPFPSSNTIPGFEQGAMLGSLYRKINQHHWERSDKKMHGRVPILECIKPAIKV